MMFRNKWTVPVIVSTAGFPAVNATARVAAGAGRDDADVEVTLSELLVSDGGGEDVLIESVLCVLQDCRRVSQSIRQGLTSLVTTMTLNIRLKPLLRSFLRFNHFQKEKKRKELSISRYNVALVHSKVDL